MKFTAMHFIVKGSRARTLGWKPEYGIGDVLRDLAAEAELIVKKTDTL
jgi:hypothetical protein